MSAPHPLAQRRGPLLFLSLAPAALASCAAPAPITAPRVQAFGSLREIVREGRRDGVVALTDAFGGALPGRHACGVGALAGLRGEVTLLEGRWWLTYPAARGDGTRTTHDARGEQAALLVVAEVPRWREVVLEEDVPFAALAGRLAALAAEHGLDPEVPFPFVIEGELLAARWHVIDGRRLAPGPSSHSAHVSAGHPGGAERVRASVVGFHSRRHHGVFTHHGDDLHLHVVFADPEATAHLDDAAAIAKGAVVRLPG